MIDKEKPLNIDIGVAKRSDPVYAINKAGDFSKKSVREPEWPQDAQPIQSMQDINENNSEGKKRFEDVIARVIQLGEIPRGLQYNTDHSTDSGDNAKGVIALGHSDPQERYEDRLKSISTIIDSSRNTPQPSFPWPVSRAKVKDKNDPGHNPNVANRVKLEASFISIPNAASDDKRDGILVTPKSRDNLRTLED